MSAAHSLPALMSAAPGGAAPKARMSTDSATRPLVIPAAVLALADLSWPARLVLAEIVNMHQATGSVWCNDQYFSNRLPGISMRAVQRAIQDLENAQLIERVTDQSAYHKRTLTPTIKLSYEAEAPAKLAIGSAVPIANLAGASSQIGESLSPKRREPIANLANINNSLNKRGNKSNTLSQKKEGVCAAENSSPVLKAEKELVPPVAAPPQPAPDAGPSFQDFWAAYGKKEDKHKSSLRWASLKPAEREAAMQALPAYVLATPDRKYRKNPLTWLNGKCWGDEEVPTEASPRPAPFGPAETPKRSHSAPTAKTSWR